MGIHFNVVLGFFEIKELAQAMRENETDLVIMKDGQSMTLCGHTITKEKNKLEVY